MSFYNKAGQNGLKQSSGVKLLTEEQQKPPALPPATPTPCRPYPFRALWPPCCQDLPLSAPGLSLATGSLSA